MRCPLCSTPTTAMGVRNTVAGRRRRRQCLNCGHKITTLEVIERPASIRGLANIFSADGPAEAQESRVEQRGLYQLLRENPIKKGPRPVAQDARQTMLPLEVDFDDAMQIAGTGSTDGTILGKPTPIDPAIRCPTCGEPMIPEPKAFGGLLCLRCDGPLNQLSTTCGAPVPQPEIPNLS